MNNQYRQKIDGLIKAKFLTPNESNRSNLTKLIKLYEEKLPKYGRELPYAGTDSSYKLLKKTSKIPDKPRNSTIVFKESLSFLSRAIRWQSPNSLQNITPPVTFESLAAGLMANLYNLNMIWDHVSAGGHSVERQVVSQLVELVGWTKKSDGVFTYGGKGCQTYAIKMGLRRCLPNLASDGLAGNKPVVITSKYNHYIIDNVCSQLNLGTNSCVKVGTNAEEVIDMVELESTLEKLLTNKTPIACIILSGGSTINLNIDPVKEVANLVKLLKDKYKLGYTPFIYFDSVVGWPWLFFKDYDFESNPLGIDNTALEKIKKATKLIQEVVYADAMGTDFHKIGFASYSCSSIIVKNATDLHSINSQDAKLVDPQEFGNNFLQHHTLEHSRSAAPVFSAWTILQGMGKDGFRLYIGKLTEISDIFREKLSGNQFSLINPYSYCFGSVFLPIIPNGPKNYEELMLLSAEEMKKVGEYVYGFSKFLSDKTKNGVANIEVGFLKTLARPPQNTPFPAIRIYPMSPFMTKKDAHKIIKEIIACKHKFDKEYKSNHLFVPNVVHR